MQIARLIVITIIIVNDSNLITRFSETIAQKYSIKFEIPREIDVEAEAELRKNATIERSTYVYRYTYIWVIECGESGKIIYPREIDPIYKFIE